MCFFLYKNKTLNKAALAGIHEYKCGCCPECLSDKARLWALKCSAHAETTPACMVTLTYDTYIRDTVTGRVIGERVSDFSVCKKDSQDFIKRLREYFSRVKNVNNIKYVLTAEYGKRTHRAHYHAILFNVTFDDLIKYKKSKRGNWIYKSATLDKLWKHGICTVDCTNISARVTRYCTKYCAKDSRADDTFMLFSRGIGDERLLEKFNGISYIIDGREYPIPRSVWIKYIESKYDIQGYMRYKSKCSITPMIYKQAVLLDKKSDDLDCDMLPKIRGELLRAYAFLGKITPKKKPREKWSPRTCSIIEHYEREIIPCRQRKLQKCVADIYYLSNKSASLFYEISKNTFEAPFFYEVGDILLYSNSLLALSNGVNQCDIRAYNRAKNKRDYYAFVRDNDSVYKRYLQYWKAKTAFIEKTRPTVRERILQLSNEKYYAYKQAALKCLNRIEYVGDPNVVRIPRKKYLPYPSRHNTANDRRYKSVPLKLYREVSGDHILDRLGVPYGQISIEIHENYKEIFELCLT